MVWGQGTLFTAFHNARTRDNRHNHKGRHTITAKSESSKLEVHASLSHSQLKRKINRSQVPRCTCQALLWQEHLQVDARELTPAARRPAGHISVAPPCPMQTAWTMAPPLLCWWGLSPTRSHFCHCFCGRQRCTAPLLPRAVWGTSAWGQGNAGMPSQGRVSGSQLRSLPVTPVTVPSWKRGTLSWKWGREALLLQGVKGEQLFAVSTIPGWAGWHSPPRWQPEWSSSSGSPSRQQLRAE